MKIPVLGMDPSMRNWGLAKAVLDLEAGVLDTPVLSLIQPKDLPGKQVRQNSSDLHLARQLAGEAYAACFHSKVVFVEVPHGSQSARAMASYGICIGVLGGLLCQGVEIIEVTALESKLVMTGKKDATKEQMIDAAKAYYPNANWPKSMAKAEHVADAIAAIHAGVRTAMFQSILRLYKKV